MSLAAHVRFIKCCSTVTKHAARGFPPFHLICGLCHADVAVEEESGVAWWIGGLGLKSTLLQALLNVSVTVKNVVVKYMAPQSVATLTCTRLSLFSATLGDRALQEVSQHIMIP